MKTRFFEKYCPTCKESVTMYLSPTDDKFACTGSLNGVVKGCAARFTNEELNEAFLRIYRDNPSVNLYGLDPIPSTFTAKPQTTSRTLRGICDNCHKVTDFTKQPGIKFTGGEDYYKCENCQCDTLKLEQPTTMNRAPLKKSPEFKPITARPLSLPTDSEERKGYPIFRGVLRYFSAALAGVSRISKIGNDKHNPGEEMYHARGKSMDHGDCILRHLIDVSDMLAANGRGERAFTDEQILAEASQMAWRALAFSQELHEQLGVAPLASGARK